MTAPTLATVGELRASGHVQKTLRTEIRDNLLSALREGRDPWPGLHGFESTVIPQLERYVKGLAPDYTMMRDLYLTKNVIPEAKEVAAQRGITFPT